MAVDAIGSVTYISTQKGLQAIGLVVPFFVIHAEINNSVDQMGKK